MFYDVLLDSIKEKFTIYNSVDARECILKHSTKVAEMVYVFTEDLNLTAIQKNELIKLSIFHDIGKFGIEPNELFKSNKLSPAERNIVKMHSEYGEAFSLSAPSLGHLSSLIRHHHEEWDGNGYPDGLKGNEIPYQCRILALADAFCAMTTDNCFRKAMDIEEVLKAISMNGGRQFDPQLSAKFIEFIKSRDYDPIKSYKMNLVAITDNPLHLQ
jgi:HD-GYP domain-containing protein (c-di-GMP phosphodiesterase class II)